MRTDPNVILQNDRGHLHAVPLLRIQWVVYRCEHDLMSYLTSAANPDTALVLETAS